MEDALYLAVNGNADINTTYIMGTAAITLLAALLAALLWTYTYFFCGWCRRYAAHFTAVGAALHTVARVHAAPFFAVGVGVMLPILLLLVCSLQVHASPFSAVGVGVVLPIFSAVGAAVYTTARVNAARFSAVGVGVMVLILLLSMPRFTQRLG